MSLLKHDKELANKLELNKAHDLSKEEKVGYVDAQIEGIKHELWRARVDAMLNHEIETRNEDEEVAVEAKIREHEGNVRRYAEAISLLYTLRDEL